MVIITPSWTISNMIVALGKFLDRLETFLTIQTFTVVLVAQEEIRELEAGVVRIHRHVLQ